MDTEYTTMMAGRKRAALTADMAREIKASTEPDFVLAVRYGVSRQTITDIRHGRSWREIN